MSQGISSNRGLLEENEAEKESEGESGVAVDDPLEGISGLQEKCINLGLRGSSFTRVAHSAILNVSHSATLRALASFETGFMHNSISH